MKKYLYAFLVVLVIVFATSCATKADSFYADKNRIHTVEKAPELNSAFKEALLESDEFDGEIESTYVNFGIYSGQFYCYFHVLTTDGRTLTYDVDDAERIYFICDDMLPSFQRSNEDIGSYRLMDGTLYHRYR